jgi:nanoRNase/pAp phosphatase (c-di-AMP/oligoRNAs hydrolase)
MFESVLSLIKAHSRIILHRHQNPDGDALGAQIGLYHILKENFPEKDILTVGDMNRRYAFITEGKEMNTVEDGAYKDALAIVLDTFTISRGMVNTMSDIRGIDTWVNFTETEDGVLCELRSSKYNINPIAVKYGGGGHQKASGATIADRETAMAMLADLDAMVEE